MNTANYFTIFEKFILELQKLSDADPAQISKAVAEICGSLRLGKVEAVVYENEAAEHIGAAAPICFYDSGNANSTVSISDRNSAMDDTVAVYNIYSINGDAEWTEEERSKIKIFIAIFSSFCEKSRLAKLAHHIAYYDRELDVYNLKYFMKSARTLCNSGKIDEFSAVRFNFKHFSVVNQDIGRKNGTLVMKKFIRMIDELFDDEGEMICRIGGDNFLTLIKNEKLQSLLSMLGGTNVVYDEFNHDRVVVSATAGVYVIKNVDRVFLPTDIMDRVSIAAQLAKNSAETDIIYFNDELVNKVTRSNFISASFPKAIEGREFLVYYQPKVAIDGRHVAGAEALCRWMHKGQIISPAEFIPVLEQGREICKLDFYVLDTVCKDIRRWLDRGKNVVRVSVNFSRRHLTDTDLLKHIIEIVDRNNVPHEYIEIELTETTTDVEFRDLKRIIGGLQQSGFSTSVDDFGIGYSSLNLIKEIPWNVLKLDKSLLPAEGDENPRRKSVMFNYIVAMTQAMGLECISEGVETKEQVQLLAENKCNLAQGFYFDRPLPVDEFETRLEKSYIYDR